jgi:hypothetical protein
MCVGRCSRPGHRASPGWARMMQNESPMRTARSTLADSGRAARVLRAAALVSLAVLALSGCSDVDPPAAAEQADAAPAQPDAAAGVPDATTSPGDAAGEAAAPAADGGAAPAPCAFARENGSGKITPDLARVYASNPGPRGVFILYKRQANVQPLPECAGGRTCPERDAAIAALDQQVAEIQRCTVERIAAIGGVFLERFWLGGITHARLTAGQALDIAGLTDVRSIEDADAPGPPPP